MSTTSNWPVEFAKVITCKACDHYTDHNLLRDTEENIPQPGYVGPDYWKRRVLLVGQNPGTPKTLAEQDKPYTRALRQLAQVPTQENFQELSIVLKQFIPKWPVHGNYFPLQAAGLSLDDIAYFNVVRCRTSADARPGSGSVRNCLNSHFTRWLDLLSPRVVVFIGKWAHDQASAEVKRRSIPFAFMNRQRSLSSEMRVKNKHEVVQLVRESDA